MGKYTQKGCVSLILDKDVVKRAKDVKMHRDAQEDIVFLIDTDGKHQRCFNKCRLPYGSCLNKSSALCTRYVETTHNPD